MLSFCTLQILVLFSYFWMWTSVRSVCFISFPQSATDYCVADVPLQGAGKQLQNVKEGIFCDAVYYQWGKQKVRRMLCLMRDNSSLAIFNLFDQLIFK